MKTLLSTLLFVTPAFAHHDSAQLLPHAVGYGLMVLALIGSGLLLSRARHLTRRVSRRQP